MLTPTCAWRVDAALIELLDARLGPPLDSYVRGWQVWLEPDGPGGETVEWRLHPPARFRMPRGVNAHDLFGEVLQALATTDDPSADPALAVGGGRVRLSGIWEVLEAFPTFGDPVAVPALVAAVTAALGGRSPDVAGTVDHARMGDEWKGRRGDYSVGAVLLGTLPAATTPTDDDGAAADPGGV